jgi:DNA processing protein
VKSIHPNHLPYWLAALYLPGVGPRTFAQWLTQFTDINALFNASIAELTSAGIAPKHIAALQQPNWAAVERDLAWAQTAQCHLVPLTDLAYPVLLKEITDPPLILYVQGNLAALSSKQLAIVGSRGATASGLENAEQFAAHLAQAELTITSGLALGIDGAAHRGALMAKGITLGVAGTGLQHIYPAAHRTLVQQILQQNGAIVSEFPVNTPPSPSNFPRRNRIIAGLSIGVLVIEATLRSGSLVTARYASEQGREVFAIPGSIHNPQARGCHQLIRQGAKLVETATDVLEELGAYHNVVFSKVSPSVKNHLSANNRQLLMQIDYAMTSMDTIILRSGLTTDQLSPILLNLELLGYVQSILGGYVRLR